jgi:hypothetical protein
VDDYGVTQTVDGNFAVLWSQTGPVVTLHAMEWIGEKPKPPRLVSSLPNV